MAKEKEIQAKKSQSRTLEQRWSRVCLGLTRVSHYVSRAAEKHEMPSGPTREPLVKSPWRRKQNNTKKHRALAEY